jgi:hypothetical protein
MNKQAQIELQKMGLSSGDHGSVSMSGAARELFEHWITFLSSLLRPYYEDSILASSSISKGVLKRSKYLEHFPHQLFDAGKDNFLTPAACLHFYQSLVDKSLYHDVSALLLAQCSRTENQKWNFPFRLSHFHMMELVVVGHEKTVDKKRQEVQSLLLSTFHRLGLKGGFETATDAFFLGDEEGAKIIQKMKGLKQEFRAIVGKDSIALASVNNHESYFGRCFAIKSGKEPASSFCAAFGIERLTAYGLLKWGADKRNWPKELRT